MDEKFAPISPEDLEPAPTSMKALFEEEATTPLPSDAATELPEEAATKPEKHKPAPLRSAGGKFAKSTPKKGLFIIAAVLLLALIAVGALAIKAALDPFDNRILPNTTVGGIPVGGLTRWEAYQLLKAQTNDTFSQQSMEVILPEATVVLSPEDTRSVFKPWSASGAAFRLGRKGTPEEKEAAVAASQAQGTDIPMAAHMKLDQSYIRSQLEAYAAQYNIAYAETVYQLNGTQPSLSEADFREDAAGQTLVLTMGMPLVELDVDAVLAQILDAYSQNTFQVRIDTIPPTTEPERPDAETLFQAFYTAPVDASLDMVTYQRIPASYGYAPDLQIAKELLDSVGYGETVQIPMAYIVPEILGDGVYFRDELGFCETPHTNSENRNTNLRLVCEALDGHILQPGEEFSYNDVVGERTAEKGYKPAPAYSGIETVNSIGGGVCQGSSTLYYAALVADLEIVERINHGFRSSYIPIGLDATVSWNGPDLKFKNNTHFPIMIKAEVADGFMRMWLYGTDEKDYYVKLESKITGYSKAETVYRDVSPDSGYKDGQRISSGSDGYYAESYSCKYSKETDELISRDFVARSSYMRVNHVVARVIYPDPPSESETP